MHCYMKYIQILTIHNSNARMRTLTDELLPVFIVYMYLLHWHVHILLIVTDHRTVKHRTRTNAVAKLLRSINI